MNCADLAIDFVVGNKIKRGLLSSLILCDSKFQCFVFINKSSSPLKLISKLLLLSFLWKNAEQLWDSLRDHYRDPSSSSRSLPQERMLHCKLSISLFRIRQFWRISVLFIEVYYNVNLWLLSLWLDQFLFDLLIPESLDKSLYT